MIARMVLAGLLALAAVPAVAAGYTATIVRDEWGIPHIHGHSDADAVYGMIYAQAEDDFPRIEANYLTSLGRLAEAEGDSAVWSDLRARLFVDPVEAARRLCRESPTWLRALMDAWAAGLNAYLADHPAVHPRVLTRFEPWMALSFSEGQHRRRYRARAAGAARGLLWWCGGRGRRRRRPRIPRTARIERHRHRAAAHPRWPRAAADQPAHQLLLPRRGAGDERRRAERLWRGDVGAVLHLPGLQRPCRVDAHDQRASTTSTPLPKLPGMMLCDRQHRRTAAASAMTR